MRLKESEKGIFISQITIDIYQDLNVSVNVNGKTIDAEVIKLPAIDHANIDTIKLFVASIDQDFEPCRGNFEECFIDIDVNSKGQSEYTPIRDSNFGETMKSVKCHGLVKYGSLRCQPCKKARVTLTTLKKRKHEIPPSQITFSSRKPHSAMSREELVEKIEDLKKENRNLKKTIETEGHELNSADHCDITSIIQDADHSKLSDYQKLFIQEQEKYNSCNPKQMRWHPTVIKWALYIQSKSAKAYDTLRESGFVNLPSRRTLYDYSHYVKGI